MFTTTTSAVRRRDGPTPATCPMPHFVVPARSNLESHRRREDVALLEHLEVDHIHDPVAVA
jgi:hypothetical protein